MMNFIFDFAYVLLYSKYPCEINDDKYKHTCFEIINLMINELIDKNSTIIFDAYFSIKD